MDRKQIQSDRAAALQLSLAIILLSISAILFATSLMASPKRAVTVGDTPPSQPAPETVVLPSANLDSSVPSSTVVFLPVTTTNIDSSEGFIGFVGDFAFDETVCTFSNPFVEPAGLTATNWNVTASILPGPVQFEFSRSRLLLMTTQHRCREPEHYSI